jgi:hypothetical protein
VEERGSRFWNAFWTIGPLVAGGLIGIYFAGQFVSAAPSCASQPSSTAANFTLAVVLVALLIGRIVARGVIGPVAARAFTLAAFGLIVVACGSYFVAAPGSACAPPTSAVHVVSIG